jgi:phosphatidylglycerol:prolipoprotein diacylglycerol transferase
MSQVVIDCSHGGTVFFITYNLAFLLVLTLFIIRNHRRGTPLTAVWTAALAGTLFFILGLSVSAIPLHDLSGFLQGHGLRRPPEKNLVGGIAGLFLGAFLAGKWMNLKKGLTDDFAVALPLGMALHRVGCLAAGCCFGRPACLPWAVCYPPGSEGCLTHPGSPLSPHGLCSVPLHPVQLYEILLALALALLVWKVRNRFRAPGNLFRFSMACYGIIWFLCEFFRDPAGVYVAGQTVFGLRSIQWILLVSSILLAVTLACRERSAGKVTELPAPAAEPGLFRTAACLLALCLLFLATGWWMAPSDRLIIALLFVPGIVMTGWKIFRTATRPENRLIFSLILFSCLVFMGQVSVSPGPGEKVRYTEIGISGMWNGFSNTVREATGYSDRCGGYFILGPEEDHRHKVLLLGVQGASRNVFSKYNEMGFYMNGFLGSDHETGSYKNFDRTRFTIAVNPGFRMDRQNVGLKAGIWLGAFRMAGFPPSPVREVGDYANDLTELYVFPQFGLRAGPSDVCYLDLHFADVTPATAAPVLFQAGVGSGFGRTDGTALVAGFSSTGFYLHGALTIRDRYQISVYGSDDLGMNLFGIRNNALVSVGIHYRFGHKVLPAEKEKF